jgi:hypothetical protein
MAYLGQVDRKASNVQVFNVTSSTSATHSIGWTPPSEQTLIITINGVKQHTNAYSFSGSTLTLGAALVATDELEVIGINDIGNSLTPVDGSVTTSKIGDNSVTLAKMAGLVRGKIIVGDASGDPSALTVGSVNQVLKSDGTDVSWGADSGGLFASYALIVDSKPEATAGGTFTLGAWRTRDLNTEVTDPDGIVSIATNAFTLAAGSYLIKWVCPVYAVGSHKTRLYDVTGTAGIQNGQSSYQNANSCGAARVAPSGSNVYRIEHYCLTTSATYGFGVQTGTGTGVEVYAQVEIFKES